MSLRHLIKPRLFQHSSFRRLCSTTESTTRPPAQALSEVNEARAREYLKKYSSYRDTPLTTSSSPQPPIKKRIPLVTGPLPTPDVINTLLEDAHGAFDVCTLDVREKSPFADFFIVCSARSERHVDAVAEGIKDDMRKSGVLVGGEVVGICGKESRDWKAVDVGPVVVHVMTEDTREKYNLEGLWGGENLPQVEA